LPHEHEVAAQGLRLRRVDRYGGCSRSAAS
jgi:hypothetical protein